MDLLRDFFGSTAHEKADAGRTVSKIKGLVTFFSDALDMAKDRDFVKAIAQATPWWVGAAGEAAAEAIPVVKFAAKLIEKLTEEPDPQILGLLACTVAYQRSVEEALKGTKAAGTAQAVSQEVRDSIAKLDWDKPDFTSFTFSNALNHPFIESAERMLNFYLKIAGYDDGQRRQLTGRVRRLFVSHLRLVLSHGKTQKRFEPFARLINAGAETGSYDTLLRHVRYQRWLYESAPLFGREPFALADVYIDTECGVLRWDQISASADRSESAAAAPQEKVDPFCEKHGGRQDLLQTVLDYIGSKDFNDAIVIQGAAGSGKSSFTQRLCAELDTQGLFPIRVRLRDLALGIGIEEALAGALFPRDLELPGEFHGAKDGDPFQKGAIFRQEITFESAKICPFVLILDGWDEISISATEGFKVQVANLLRDVRTTFFRGTYATVRVILTGRPSDAIGDSAFLYKGTPILTIRPIQPKQLEKFVGDLRRVLQKPRLPVKVEPAARWTVPDADHWKKVFERYAADFKKQMEAEMKSGRTAPGGSMEVLGLPLLAQLAIRLISEWEGDREALIANPTTLYRHMVDLTCVKGGKDPGEKFREEDSYFKTGADLRKLLRGTAAAMTAYGEESISFRELALRLKLDEDALDLEASEAAKTHPLTSLMISFFFKGGHASLGCEFLHKSFREYLFAEAIVGALKDFGRDSQPLAAPRADYWKDFEPSTQQYRFSRALAELLAPQWLSKEVARHLQELLVWEIARTAAPAPVTKQRGEPTQPLTMAQWERVRDGLAEVWHWWSEGVHLRPQPSYQRNGTYELTRAYVEELIKHDLPYDPIQRKRKIAPARSATMDGHLGDGLMRLAAPVHFQIARRTGWLGPNEENPRSPEALWEGVSEIGKGPRPGQTLIEWQGYFWVLFAPSGMNPAHFGFLRARIDAAGWRPSGAFPAGLSLDGVDLRQSVIAGPYWERISWRFANLFNADAQLGHFPHHDFRSVLAINLMGGGSHFSAVQLDSGDFRHADFPYATLRDCSFRQADLRFADFEHSIIRFASFDGVMLERGALVSAHVDDIGLSVPPHALKEPEQPAEPEVSE